eukprot:8707861-Pyramimonas_sp.AAC.1
MSLASSSSEASAASMSSAKNEGARTRVGRHSAPRALIRLALGPHEQAPLDERDPRVCRRCASPLVLARLSLVE